MSNLIDNINQISIYLMDEAERVNEVALFQPLIRKSEFDENSKPIAARKWRYTDNIPLLRRITLRFQCFLFKHLSQVIPAERITPEAKFKTVLAILLAQESVRDYFLSNRSRRKNFLRSLHRAALSCNYPEFSRTIADETTPLKISRQLTQLEGKEFSLIDDLAELNLQMAALPPPERSEILYRILSHVERPPITSVIEISGPDATQSIPLTTKYAKYKIDSYDKKIGKISYTSEENRATSSIKTKQNMLPGAKGTMNQRVVYDFNNEEYVGSYCGELSTVHHVLEQILFITEQKGEVAYLLDSAPKDVTVTTKKILFTSLYSWDEIGLITDQHSAIRKCHQKILQCDDNYYLLDILYFNIPFNAFNRYPTPGEIKATIQDINDESLILLTAQILEKMGVLTEDLKALAGRMQTLRSIEEHNFLLKEKEILTEIDTFRELTRGITKILDAAPQTQAVIAVKGLLTNKRKDGRALKGIDKLLYLDCLAREIGYFHNKNCQNATDRSAGADAADKAQHTYQKLQRKFYLPGTENEEAELPLFKILYSMYLVWEEPEINTALSTGFLGEKFYQNFFQKNPETTRYLVRWLKKHPELYLGLSDYRT